MRTLIILLSTFGLLPAQGLRDVNSESIWYTASVTPPESGVLRYTATDHGVLHWQTWNPVVSNQQYQLVNIDRLGSLQHLGSGRFLISGQNSTTLAGYVEVLALDHTNLTVSIEHTRVFPSPLDPFYVKFNPQDQKLYIQDMYLEAVLAGDWNGSSPLPGLAPGELVAIADPISVPELADPFRVELVIARSPGCFVIHLGEHTTSGGTHIFEDPVLGWQFDIVGGPSPDPNRFYVDGRSIVASIASQGPIRIQGPAGSYSVRNTDSGAIVSSGTLAQSGIWEDMQMPVSGELEPGFAHTIENVGVQSSEGFVPTVRYGAPLSLGGFNVRRRGLLTPSSMFLGNLDFSVAAYFGYDNVPAPGSNAVLQTAVWVGARDAQGDDPVTFMGPTAVLDPFWVSPATPLTVTDLIHFRPASFRVPISNSPALEGRVFLFQIVATTPGPNPQAIGTDVFGTTVLGAPAASAFSAGSSSVQEGQERIDAALKRLADEFSNALELHMEGKASLSPTQELEVQTIRAAIRKQVR